MIEFMGKCQAVTHRKLRDGVHHYSGQFSFVGADADVVFTLTEEQANAFSQALKRGVKLRGSIELVEP